MFSGSRSCCMMWPPDIWLRGGHWPWHCFGHCHIWVKFCIVLQHQCLPSRQVITCCFLASWKYSFKTCWWCQSWSCWWCWCQWWGSYCCYCCYCHNMLIRISWLLSWCRKWWLLLWYTWYCLVSQPDRWSFSFILGPLHWSSISNIPRTQKYSAVEY